VPWGRDRGWGKQMGFAPTPAVPRSPGSPYPPSPAKAETLSETPAPEDHAAIVGHVQGQAYAELLATDQLAREMAAGRVFVGFKEAPIVFPPTFKVRAGPTLLSRVTPNLAASLTHTTPRPLPRACSCPQVAKGVPGLSYSLKRSPAWTDRVLVRSNLPHRQAAPGAYYCCPDVATSDHKPVAAVMTLPLGEPRRRAAAGRGGGDGPLGCHPGTHNLRPTVAPK
jgi:hypothetical protein